MQSKVLLATTCLILGCAAGVVASDAIAPTASAVQGAPTWENRCQEVKWDEVLGTNDLRRELGDVGFELVSLVSAEQKGAMTMKTRIIACFKRRSS